MTVIILLRARMFSDQAKCGKKRLGQYEIIFLFNLYQMKLIKIINIAEVKYLNNMKFQLNLSYFTWTVGIKNYYQRKSKSEYIKYSFVGPCMGLSFAWSLKPICTRVQIKRRYTSSRIFEFQFLPFHPNFRASNLGSSRARWIIWTPIIIDVSKGRWYRYAYEFSMLNPIR